MKFQYYILGVVLAGLMGAFMQSMEAPRTLKNLDAIRAVVESLQQKSPGEARECVSSLTQRDLDNCLHYALAYNDKPLVSLLLSAKANPNGINGAIFSDVVKRCDCELVEIFLDAGAQFDNGRSHFLIAVAYNKIEAAKLLYERGAAIDKCFGDQDPDAPWDVIVKTEGKNALYYALRHGQIEFALWLKDRGVAIDQQVEEKLWAAIQRIDDYELFKLIQSLLECFESNIPERASFQKGPFFHYHRRQMRQGVFLESFIGLPCDLNTPWGTIKLFGSGCLSHIVAAVRPLLQKLVLAPLPEPQGLKAYHEDCVVHVVCFINGTKVPPAICEADGDYYLSDRAIKEAWSHLNDRYQRERAASLVGSSTKSVNDALRVGVLPASVLM